MTNDRSKMRDGDMPLLDRIDVALRRVTNGEGQMRVPVEATDPDVVLFDCKHEIERLSALAVDQKGVLRDLLADAAVMKQRLAEAKLEAARLRKELAEVGKDAARYRWLRGEACPDHSVRWTQWEVRCWRAPFWTSDLRHVDLDEEIDAAMRKEGHRCSMT